MTRTPEFIRWALALACPLRQQDRWQDPERTERQLRPLREYSDAILEKRIYNGICLRDAIDSSQHVAAGDTLAFFAEEILEVYGGQAYVHSLCARCPANVASRGTEGALVGCFGWYVVTDSSLDLINLVEKIIVDLDLQQQVEDQFLPTRPRWYGLWANSPLSAERAKLLHRILHRLPTEAANQQLTAIVAALDSAVANQIPLHVDLVPHGESDAVSWTVASHCSRCKAELSVEHRCCRVCGRSGHATPARRRNPRGRRPFQPLTTLLGEDRATEFLQEFQV